MEINLLGSGCKGGACSDSTSPAKVRLPEMFNCKASWHCGASSKP